MLTKSHLQPDHCCTILAMSSSLFIYYGSFQRTWYFFCGCLEFVFGHIELVSTSLAVTCIYVNIFLVKYSKDLYKHSQDKAFLSWRTSSRNSNALTYSFLFLGTMLTAMRNVFSLEGSDVILLKSSEPPLVELWLSFLTLNFSLIFHLAITRSSKVDWVQTGLNFFLSLACLL